jgi:hypothetical protein
MGRGGKFTTLYEMHCYSVFHLSRIRYHSNVQTSQAIDCGYNILQKIFRQMS